MSAPIEPPSDADPGPLYFLCEDPDCPHRFAYQLREGGEDPHYHPKAELWPPA